MYKIPLPELKQKILASGKIAEPELLAKIKAKINELSGLVSEEGAAHIIANELGIELVTAGAGKLKVKEIYAGMRSVTTTGKVVRKFEAREFSKGDRQGRVASLILGDETGTIRVVFWNDQVSQFEKLQENDILAIKNAYVKENRDDREIHLNDKAELEVNPAGEQINAVRQGSSFQRKTIQGLQEGEEGVELLGTVVQVFDPRFFQVCPQCSKRISDTFVCAQHGQVSPATSYVMNAILDDGTGTIRGVFWKNQTQHLLQKQDTDLLQYKESLVGFEELKTELLGEQLKVRGRVKNNEMFGRLEFNVQLVERAKPEEELARLESVQMEMVKTESVE